MIQYISNFFKNIFTGKIFADFDALTEAAETCRSERDALQVEVENIRRRNLELSEAKTKLASQLKDADDVQVRLHSDYAVKERELTTANATIDTQTAAIENLAQQVEKLTKDLEVAQSQALIRGSDGRFVATGASIKNMKTVKKSKAETTTAVK